MITRILIVVLLSLIIIFSFNQITQGGLAKRFMSISIDAAEVISDGENAEKAGSIRIFIWKRVIQMISEKPLFGYGIENLAEPFVKKYENDMTAILGKVYLVDKAHNEYLHIAVTSGIPSLVLYLLFTIQILYEGLKRLKVSSIYWPIMSAIIGYLSQAFFNISVVSVAYIFWVFLGLATNYADATNSEKIS